MDSEATSSLTSKGQVTIPKALRQQLGLARGSRVSFQLVGDHIELVIGPARTIPINWLTPPHAPRSQARAARRPDSLGCGRHHRTLADL